MIFNESYDAQLSQEWHKETTKNILSEVILWLESQADFDFIII